MPLKAGVDVILSSSVNCLCEKKIKSRQIEENLRFDFKVRNSVRKKFRKLNLNTSSPNKVRPKGTDARRIVFALRRD